MFYPTINGRLRMDFLIQRYTVQYGIAINEAENKYRSTRAPLFNILLKNG